MFKKNFKFAHQNPTLTSERHGRTARILTGQPKQDNKGGQPGKDNKTGLSSTAASPRRKTMKLRRTGKPGEDSY
jgi:hypothetical protein